VNDCLPLPSFLFFCPLFMSGLWIAGGVYFWRHWERLWDWGEGKVRQVPELPGNPLVSILIPCFNEAGNGEEPLLFVITLKI